MKRFVIIAISVLICLNLKAANASDTFRVLILGNSMTVHGIDKKIGWNGNWGMAASAPEKDYVNLLTKSLQQVEPKSKVYALNISSSFERRFWDLDTSNFTALKNFKPNVIIFRLGENLVKDSVSKYSISEAFLKLLKYIESGKTGGTKIIITSLFWPNKKIDQEIKLLAANKKWCYVDISSIASNPQNMAIGLFENKGVSRHPSDSGMYLIYQAIWNKLKELL